MSMPSMPAASTKRHRVDASGPSGTPSSGANYPPPFAHPYQQAQFAQQQFPLHQPQQAGYNMWQAGQQQPPFANQPPPHPHAFGQQPGMYRSPATGGAQTSPSMTPDRAGQNWNGYRVPTPQQAQGRRQNVATNVSQRPKPASGASTPSNVPQLGNQQPSTAGQQFQKWGQPQQHWPGQAQWGGAAPPHVWPQGHHTPMPPQQSPTPANAASIAQPNIYHPGATGKNKWTTGSNNSLTSPARPSSRLRSSPADNSFAMTSNGMSSPVVLCQPVGIDGSATPDQGAYVDGRQPLEDDVKSKAASEGKNSAKDDKARGSYRCGRCGVPKKGHVCPYQPKLKRRADEPPPVLRNAAVQVEMDEFMTLRRLNIQIQGFPESYAASPHISEDMVVGEARVPDPATVALVVHPRTVVSEGGNVESGGQAGSTNVEDGAGTPIDEAKSPAATA